MNKINETDLIRMIGLQDDLANSIQRKLRERIDRLSTENARLRAALQRIAMRCQNCDEGNEYATCICFSEPFADQIARAALEGEDV